MSSNCNDLTRILLNVVAGFLAFQDFVTVGMERIWICSNSAHNGRYGIKSCARTRNMLIILPTGRIHIRVYPSVVTQQAWSCGQVCWIRTHSSLACWPDRTRRLYRVVLKLRSNLNSVNDPLRFSRLWVQAGPTWIDYGRRRSKSPAKSR